MDTFESFERLIYTANDRNFDQIALQLFHFQAERNVVYNEYLQNLGVRAEEVNAVSQIPFLPISFFKTRRVRTGDWKEDIIFSSSGTTGTAASMHAVRIKFYLQNAARIFEHFFGSPGDYVFLALLPGYLDRPGSSLVAMVDHFIKSGNRVESGFFRDDREALEKNIEATRYSKVPTVLWGVTFALLDFAESNAVDLSHCIVIETGGMKGMRAELTREELHAILKNRFGVSVVHSEYGMTELMSQAYSLGDGLFEGPPWMKISIRDAEDPLERLPGGRVGGINVIDLANIYSCAFVETEDLGRLVQKGRFEVLGRLDNSDIRGCNLLG